MHLAAEDPITAEPRPEGLAALVPLIDAARADALGDVVLLDNGDGAQGTPMAEWHARCGAETLNPLRAALAQLDCAVTTLGNHEFDFGLDYLAKVLAEPGPAVVCCNLYWPDHPVSEGVVLDVGRLKMGVTGVVPPRIHVWHRRLLEGVVRAGDPVQSVAKAATLLRERGADLVVCLCHGGIVPEGHLEEARDNPARAIAASGAVDALITGHQHLQFPDPAFPYQAEDIDHLAGALHGIPTVMPPALGRGIGLLDLCIARSDEGVWTVTEHHAELRNATEMPTAGILDDIIGPARRSTARRLDMPLSHTSVPLWTAHATLEDMPAMRLIQQAQLWYMARNLPSNVPHLAAASPFRVGGHNGPEAYTRISAGPLTRRSVADLYPYENPFVALRVTGRTIRDWLEMSAGLHAHLEQPDTALHRDGAAAFNFDMIAPLAYRIDLSYPPAFDEHGQPTGAPGRVSEIVRNGVVLRDDTAFWVGTNTYRAGGGGSFPGLAEAECSDEGPPVAQLICAFLEAHPTGVDLGDPAWALTAEPGATALFDTDPLAPPPRQPAERLQVVQGFQRWRLRF